MDLVGPDAPPTLIVHGRNDSLVPVVEAAHFAELLAAVSTSPVVYAELPGAQHAFDVFRSVRSAQAAAAVERFSANSFGPPGAAQPQGRLTKQSTASPAGARSARALAQR